MTDTITVHIPMKLKRRGGRKLVVTPDGVVASAADAVTAVPTTATARAIARAFRWKWLLEAGEYGSLNELAKAEQITPAFISRLLRLTLLSPRIIEAALDDRLADGVGLEQLLVVETGNWREQGHYILN